MAQKEAAPITANRALYLELGGNGIYYSVNYEQIFFQKGSFRAAARIGVSAAPRRVAAKNYFSASIPLEVTAFWGRKNHFAELGVGYTPWLLPDTRFNLSRAELEYESYKVTSIVPFRIGYRYQKSEGGFFFRIAYMPTLDFTADRNSALVPLFGGISIGKSF
ncbi:hypothetical protein [Cesiribacter sp. SM1]|uniref:hypothetical protein n=1 Tax=Cesiribacter sp. SM1 TaxID=2861196 RepID=UPI001CD7914E|nr:hypothetical protein [Cesiribacter sp. SM1]